MRAPPTKTRRTRDHTAVGQPHAHQPIILDDGTSDLTLDDRNTASRKLFPIFGTQFGDSMEEENHVIGPLANHERLVHRKFRALGDHAERLITHAVPVAVRAVQHIASPTLAEDFEFYR